MKRFLDDLEFHAVRVVQHLQNNNLCENLKKDKLKKSIPYGPGSRLLNLSVRCFKGVNSWDKQYNSTLTRNRHL
jgi:hypothetical protein